MQVLLIRAFSGINNGRVTAPRWANTERFDVDARAPEGAPALDGQTVAPMIRALLADRFKMTYHTEVQPVTMYSLESVKPRMQKADPGSRSGCQYVSPPAGSPPVAISWTCQNTTMARFAYLLQGMAAGSLEWSVTDDTQIDGGWDFTLLFIRSTALFGRGADQQAADAAPPIAGYSIFEALEKELGLKVETVKRSMPVTVIDHLENRPTVSAG